MSLEGPENRILADQMEAALIGHRVVACDVHDVAGLQRSGFVNRDLDEFDLLVGKTVTGVSARGNTIRMSFEADLNLVISPEYGGRLRLYPGVPEIADKTHLELTLDDGSVFTVRLTGMGVLRVEDGAGLQESYTYVRDFSDRPDPSKAPIAFVDFDRLLGDRRQALKTVLVGRDAAMVGLSNAMFQDVLYRARIHPRRKASELTHEERERLHDELSDTIEERLEGGGKVDFVGLHGTPGRYEPQMGPNRKSEPCSRCGSPIVPVSLGGGRVYHCPVCQT